MIFKLFAELNLSGLWAIYNDIYVTYDYDRGNHYDWFLTIGLPTEAKEFDKIIRGYFNIDNRILKIDMEHGNLDIVFDKSNRLIDNIGNSDKYDSFEFYYGTKKVSKKSFKLFAANPENEKEEQSTEYEEPTENEETEEDAKDVEDTIRDAAENKKLLKVDYRDRFGNITRGRYVEPWEFRDQYVFFWDVYGDPSTSGETGTKQFIIGSILKWELTDEPYEDSDRFPMKI